jgi:hypothetical protein
MLPWMGAGMVEDNSEILLGRTVEKVAVIIVHGIGEQRRFEFLEEETRKIVNAIIATYGARRRDVTPTLTTGSSDAYLGDQQDWTSGATAPLHALVELDQDTIIDIAFHEVWWADINEAPTIGKQLRFWAWGLSLAGIASHDTSSLPGAVLTRAPQNAGMLKWRNRLRMAFISSLFGLSAFSVAFINLIIKQFGLSALPATATIVNYLSGVKLYNQNIRAEGSPMDGPDEPPRAAIRRRMIRAMIDVARGDYNRWYILAHSLGTIVAWNGLMETADALPNYLDQKTWGELQSPLRGSREDAFDINAMMPNRPLWLDNHDIIDRKALFEKFRGILTYGSPLERFCALWSASVPVNLQEYVFNGAEWINVYDPTDPVGTWLSDYDPESPKQVAHNANQISPGKTALKPQNFPCRASPFLLYSHLCYLRSPHPGHADAETFLVRQIARWLVKDESLAGQIDRATKSPSRFWLPHKNTLKETQRAVIGRAISAYSQAVSVAAALTIFTVLWIKYIIGWAARLVGAYLPAQISSSVADLWSKFSGIAAWFANLLVAHLGLPPGIADFLGDAILLWLVIIVVVGGASWINHLLSTNTQEQLKKSIAVQKTRDQPRFR